MEWHKGKFVVSDDKALLDLNAIHNFLSKEAYWAKDRSMETIRKSIDGSFCLGLYKEIQQTGFARVITDYSTFAYLCDVYVIEEHRRKRIGHFILDCLFSIPELSQVTWLLKTTYAQSLYKDFGFLELKSIKGWMGKKQSATASPTPKDRPSR